MAQAEAVNMTPLNIQQDKRFGKEKVPMCFIECNDTTIAPNVQFFQKKDPSAGAACCWTSCRGQWSGG
jgi:hypothetical protein